MKRVDKQQSGFTLMEATVALAMLTIGMLGLGGAFSQIVKANAISRQKQMSTLLAERQMVRLRIAGVTGLAQTSGAFETPFEGYTWEAQIVCRSEDPEVVDVWIKVKHRSGTGARLWSRMVVANGG